MVGGIKIRTRLLIGAFILAGLLAIQLLVVLPKQLNELGLQGAKDRAAAISALTAGAVQPGLAFEDELALSSALSPLSQAPDVRYALVFNVDGERIAQHPKALTPTPHKIPPPPGDASPGGGGILCGVGVRALGC